MSSKTRIEWADAVINPMRGCRKISPGCKHCYAATFAERFRGVEGHPYERGFDPRFVPEALDKIPKKPQVYFVNSMSDLFLEDFSPRQIADVFAAFTWHPKSTFLILTKRAERMRELMDDDGPIRRYIASTWPLPNVWLGVSAEYQQRADERIPLLLQTPAAHRSVSLEPLLGPIDLRHLRDLSVFGGQTVDALSGYYNHAPYGEGLAASLDQVIAGGESGPGARECRVEWLRSLRDQCAAAGIPFFLKQLGSNVVDRNDAGFEGDTPTSWPMDSRVEHLSPRNWQGEDVRVRLEDAKGGDPSEWPEDLRRCRELAWR